MVVRSRGREGRKERWERRAALCGWEGRVVELRGEVEGAWRVPQLREN